jgi:hypothetical protein
MIGGGWCAWLPPPPPCTELHWAADALRPAASAGPVRPRIRGIADGAVSWHVSVHVRFLTPADVRAFAWLRRTEAGRTCRATVLYGDVLPPSVTRPHRGAWPGLLCQDTCSARWSGWLQALICAALGGSECFVGLGRVTGRHATM